MLGDKICDVYALGALAVLLLVPVQLLYLELQFVYDFGFFVGKANCAELLLLEFDLHLFLPPEGAGDGDEAVREENYHQEHPEGVGSGHGQGEQFLQIELAFDEKVDEEGNAEDCEDSIYDEIVDDGCFDPGLDGELAGCFVLLLYGEDDPGEEHDGVVDAFPGGAEVEDSLHGVVDVEGEQDHDAEAGQPGEVDHDLDGWNHLRQGVLVDQVGHIQQCPYHLRYQNRVKHLLNITPVIIPAL